MSPNFTSKLPLFTLSFPISLKIFCLYRGSWNVEVVNKRSFSRYPNILFISFLITWIELIIVLSTVSPSEGSLMSSKPFLNNWIHARNQSVWTWKLDAVSSNGLMNGWYTVLNSFPFFGWYIGNIIVVSIQTQSIF